MYLRTIQRKNTDGSVVRYLQLAHNSWDSVRQRSTTQVLCSFGREDALDRQGLARLVRSISRFLEPADAVAASASGEVKILDSRPMGSAYVADQLWQRLGIASAVSTMAAGRRLDAAAVERTLFMMVANRLSVRPLSKLAGVAWAEDRVYLDGVDGVTSDACYRAMDFLLGALGELQETVFFTVANLLNLEVDLLFFDTTSTYFDVDRVADELVMDHDDTEDAKPQERAQKAYSKHSKDHRPDCPQIVIAMAVTREGIPVRLWSFPGTTSDQTLIRTVKDDLGRWNLNRVIWVLDRGFTSAENRRYLQRAGGHYIVGEKLRSDHKEAAAALSRQGRYRTVAGNLRVKEVRVDDQAMRDRFVICHNPERAERDKVVRAEIVKRLEEQIAGSDSLSAAKRSELAGALRTKPAFNRFLRRTKSGLLRVDRAAVNKEIGLDGKFLLRTSDETMSADDIALGYKALYEVERGWRDLKSAIELRPVYHRLEDRIAAHIQLCWLALLIMRVAEIECHDTWRNLRNELDRMHLVTMATAEGQVSQRSELTAGHRAILGALELPEPARFHDFTPFT
jgi:Transposase DDE domain